MSATPIRLWSLKVPSTGEIVALEELGIPLNVSITMAAIDPTEEVKGDAPKLSTLKLLHQNMGEPDVEDFDDDESIDSDLASGEDDSEGEEEEEEEKPKSKGGDKKADKADKKTTKKAADNKDDEESDDDDLLLEDSEDDDDDYEEVVICTLDSTKTYQQPLQLTIGDGEPVFFKATGAYTIYLSGNYVTEPRQLPPSFGGEGSDEEDDLYSDEDEEEFDMDDEAELREVLARLKSGAYDGVDADSDEESDDLDDQEDPRITEVDDDEEEVPTLVKSKKAEEVLTNKEKKAAAKAAQLKAKAAETAVKAITAKDSKKKRSADEMDIDIAASSETLSNGTTTITKATATVSATETTPSNLSKKQQKKLKANSGEPVTVSTPTEKKKVQFASQLEQGPTPNGNKSPVAAEKSKDEKPATQSSKSRTVDGVKIEDHKVGTGPEAKKGQKVSMRYIGKLTDGKVFDSNKKGKPFTFNLGKGDVIKGWDIGVAGMKVGGERKLVIPANLAYGNKALPGIPKNSTLVFEVKLLEIK